jgi:hypothetical protein
VFIVEDMCEFITTGPSTKRVSSRCAMRLCVFTAVPNTKLFAWGEEDSGGHVL